MINLLRYIDEHAYLIYNLLMRVIISTLLVVLALTAPEEDRVTALDGYYDFSNEFKMYSGYLELQNKPLISAHYVFITSKNKP